jgi:hypothetical protein
MSASSRAEWSITVGNPIVTDVYTSVCVDRLTFDDDGRIERVRMTTEGLRATLPPA